MKRDIKDLMSFFVLLLSSSACHIMLAFFIECLVMWFEICSYKLCVPLLEVWTGVSIHQHMAQFDPVSHFTGVSAWGCGLYHHEISIGESELLCCSS